MFCNKCGAELKGDSLFCEKCGTKLDEITLAELQNEQSSQAVGGEAVKAVRSKKPLIIGGIAAVAVVAVAVVLIVAKPFGKRAVVGNDGGVFGIGGNTKPDGLYIPLENGYFGDDNDFWKSMSIDEHIQDMTGKTYSKDEIHINKMFQLKGDTFEMYSGEFNYDNISSIRASYTKDDLRYLNTTSGTFTTEDDGIHFKYSEIIKVDKISNATEKNKVDVELADKDTYIVPNTGRGAYCYVSNNTITNPMAAGKTNLPVMFKTNFETKRDADTGEDVIKQTYMHYNDGVLWFPLDDTKLVGKYKKGNDFKIESSSEMINYSYKKVIEENNTLTISFSEGSWELYDPDGELVSNGKYEESETVPGLLAVYITKDSELRIGDYKTMKERLYDRPYFIYITEDGEVTWPYMIRVSEVEE